VLPSSLFLSKGENEMKLTDEQRIVLQGHWKMLIKNEVDPIMLQQIILDMIEIILKGETS
jgi:hypothetical protein